MLVTTVKHMLKTSLDQLRSLLCQLALFGRRQPSTVVVNGPSRLVMAIPIEQTVRFWIGNSRLPNSAIQFFHYFPRMLALVRNDLRRNHDYRRTCTLHFH